VIRSIASGGARSERAKLLHIDNSLGPLKIDASQEEKYIGDAFQLDDEA
jgi:hypothetical protein